jgi:glutathione S-transferase
MRYIDQVLAKQPFLTGGQFTMADITAFAGVLFAAIAKIEVPRELGNLISWHERVAGRPSVAYA